MAARLSSVFMGHFIGALKAVGRLTDLAAVIGEEGKTPTAVQDYCARRSLPLHYVTDSVELSTLFKKRKELRGRTFFSAGCGLLFPQAVIDVCVQVVNFHPGDLFTCRGKHPLPFAILKKLSQMCISAHCIDSEKIDAGPLIARFFMPIDYSTSYAANERILLSALPGFVASVIVLLHAADFKAWSWRNEVTALYNKKLEPDILARVLNSKHIGML
jgi:methionyl-tRNA formyltransferase